MLEVLNRPEYFAFVGNPIVVRVKDQSENFQRFLYCVKFVNGEQSEDFEAYRDTEGEAVLNISSLIEPFFRNLFVPSIVFLSDFPANLNRLQDDISKKYRFEITSEHSDGQTFQSEFSGVAIFGKVDRQKKGLYSSFIFYEEGQEFLNLSGSNQKLISWQEPLVLCLLQLVDNSSVPINVYFELESGESTVLTIDPVLQGDILSIVADLKQIFPEGDVEKFFVRIVHDPRKFQVNTIFEYTIDSASHLNEDSYLFRNRFGGMETIRLFGERIEKLDANRSLAQGRYLAPNSSSKSSEFISSVIERKSWDVYTGYLESWADFEIYEEFFISSEIYRVVGDDLFPAEITTKKLTTDHSDPDQIPGSKLTMRYLI